VLVKGLDTREHTVAELSRIVGYIFQNPDHQIFERTVEDEIAFGPRNLGLSEEHVRKRVNEVIELLGLDEYRRENPVFVGKGVRQKIATASILAMRPEVIICDEPTTGMDWLSSAAMMKLLDKLNKEGRTVIIITHDMRVVAEHSKRTICLSGGKVLLDLPTREIFMHEKRLKEAFIEPPQIIKLAKRVGHPSIPLTIKDELELANIIEKLKVSI